MSVKQRLIDSAQASSYFVIEPQQLEDLYGESRRFVSSGLSSLDEGTQFSLLYQHFHLALLTGDDAVAKVTLQRISDRFGESSPFVGVMKAEYVEATEGPEAAQKYLNTRETTDFAAFKRKAVILKQKNDYKTYIQELLKYVSICPTDSEAWAELAEAYYVSKLYAQSVHSLQEVVINSPLAYNVFARIGEVLHTWATVSSATVDQLSRLKSSVQNFLRAVELCPNYVRGWAGVYIVSNKLLKFPKLTPEDRTLYTDLVNSAKKQLEKIVNAKDATEKNLQAAEAILKS